MKIRLSTFLCVALGSVAVNLELHVANGPGSALRFDGTNAPFPDATNSFTS